MDVSSPLEVDHGHGSEAFDLVHELPEHVRVHLFSFLPLLAKKEVRLVSKKWLEWIDTSGLITFEYVLRDTTADIVLNSFAQCDVASLKLYSFTLASYDRQKLPTTKSLTIFNGNSPNNIIDILDHCSKTGTTSLIIHQESMQDIKDSYFLRLLEIFNSWHTLQSLEIEVELHDLAAKSGSSLICECNARIDRRQARARILGDFIKNYNSISNLLTEAIVPSLNTFSVILKLCSDTKGDSLKLKSAINKFIVTNSKSLEKVCLNYSGVSDFEGLSVIKGVPQVFEIEQIPNFQLSLWRFPRSKDDRDPVYSLLQQSNQLRSLEFHDRKQGEVTTTSPSLLQVIRNNAKTLELLSLHQAWNPADFPICPNLKELRFEKFPLKVAHSDSRQMSQIFPALQKIALHSSFMKIIEYCYAETVSLFEILEFITMEFPNLEELEIQKLNVWTVRNIREVLRGSRFHRLTLADICIGTPAESLTLFCRESTGLSIQWVKNSLNDMYTAVISIDRSKFNL